MSIRERERSKISVSDADLGEGEMETGSIDGGKYKLGKGVVYCRCEIQP